MNSCNCAIRAAVAISSRLASGSGVGQVVIQRIVEQHRVLRHDADGRAHALLGHVAKVLTVDQDLRPLVTS
jgi:hypothetical protein